MKKAKNTWRKFKRNWRAKTPKRWNWIFVTFTSLSGAAGIGWLAIAAAGIIMPEGYQKYVGSIIGTTSFIAAFAKSQVKLPVKTTK